METEIKVPPWSSDSPDSVGRGGVIWRRFFEKGCRPGREQLHIWYDTRHLAGQTGSHQFFSRVLHNQYTGVILYPENLREYAHLISNRMLRIIHVDKIEELVQLLSTDLLTTGADARSDHWVIASPDARVLDFAQEKAFTTCLRARIADVPLLHRSIELGRQHPYLAVSLCDPTNIPLELVIASLQQTSTILIKEVDDPKDVHDAIVSLGVMEVGADGVMFSPLDHGTMDRFLADLQAARTGTMAVEQGIVVRSEPIGMGHRSCIDLVTLFSTKEGMIVGSTSQGGVLCCPEVFHLPYMERRPFRVNAGGVHSYVYSADDRTNYLSELRAGLPATIVSVDGTVRQVPIGRVKTEVRPLRLVEVQFLGGEFVNIIMQDDWHVRVYSGDGLPLNITELKPGDVVLGHLASPGRHVGIKIDETIIET